MKIEDIMKRMIDISEGNLHDIAHFIKVHSFARLIGRCEGISDEKQFLVEASALIHDIACPLCREKYGHTAGRLQEKESAALIKSFFKVNDISPEKLERLVYIVSHHHSPEKVDDIDFQILIEADFLVNADEGDYTPESIRQTGESFFRTNTGKHLLKTIYQL